MSTRTNTTISRTSRGRGRGSGRGRASYHNNNFIRENLPHDENMRLRGSFHNQRSLSSSSRPKSFENSRENNSRPKSDNSNRSSSPSKSSNKIPSHAQNPFFVGELMSRFNNMVPTPSFIIEDREEAQQKEILLNSTKTNSSETMRNIRAQPVCGISTCDSNKNSNFHGQNKNNKKINQNGPQEDGWSRVQGKSNVKRLHTNTSQLTLQNQVASFSSTGENARDIRVPRSNDRPVFKSDFVTNKASVASSNSTSPISPEKFSFNKKKESMQTSGFNTESVDQGLNINQNKNKDLNQPLQNYPYGLIAERASPRIKYNLQNSPPVVEENKFYNSITKQNYHHPQVSSVMNSKKFSNSSKSSPKSNQIPMQVNFPPESKQISKERSQSTCAQHTTASDNFFTQLKKIQALTDSADDGNVVKNQVEHVPKENRITPSRPNGSKFNPFLKTENHTSSEQCKQGSNSNVQMNLENFPSPRRYKHETNNSNPTFFEDSYTEIFTDVTGRNHFSVQRPVRDANERVLSRTEALERIQQEYVIQRAEAEAKKREKEAKKRQEYLARYSHVDQGHRLSEGLLDEAAGYAPGYIQYETVEDIRMRQQEQLNRDALAFMEREREDQEKQRRLEEKKARIKLDKNKHISAGYRLGGGENRGADFLTESQTEEEALQRQEEQLVLEMIMQNERDMQAAATEKRNADQVFKEPERKQVLNSSKTVSVNSHISATSSSATDPTPGYIQYETVEDIRMRQQEQLNRDALAFMEREREDQEKQRRLEEKKARIKLDKNKHISAGYRLGGGENRGADFLTESQTEEEALQRQEEQLVLEMIKQNERDMQAAATEKRNVDQVFKEPERKQVLNSSKTASVNPHISATSSSATVPSSSRNGQIRASLGAVPKYSNKSSNRDEQSAKNDTASKLTVPEDMAIRPKPQVEQQILKKSEVPGPPHTSEAVEMKPASCTLRNKNGPVLVLRPTAADLNRALITRMEIQDEVDKLGHSSVYIPSKEQTPMYSNNRFERKSGLVADEVPTNAAAVGMATGAIPKNTSKPVQIAEPNKTTHDETPSQEEPAIDYKAELRAARLRFQQQYDNNLKKKQVLQNTDS